MGFLNEIKKVMFGVKAVTKSAADKAAEAGKEAGNELLEKSGQWMEQAKDKAEELTGDLAEKAGTLYQQAKHKTEDVADRIFEEAAKASEKAKEKIDDLNETYFAPKAEDTPAQADQPLSFEPDEPMAAAGPKSRIEEVGSKVLDTAENIGGKILDAAEDLGGRILGTKEKASDALDGETGELADKASEMGNKAMDTAEKVGAVVLDKAGDIWDKAKTMGSSVFDKAEDMVKKAQGAAERDGTIEDAIEKAKRMEEEMAAKIEKNTKGFDRDPINTKDSLLDGKDSFFDKAKRFADGDYPPATGKPKVELNPDFQKTIKPGTAAGFEDLDGDGNEIVDDAIIVD